MLNEQNTISCSGNLYTIRSGDTFFTIARRYGISIQNLINANPQISDPTRIIPGQVICIPVGSQECPGQYYIVQPGDNLSVIAVRFGVSIQQILSVNPQITNVNVINVGQRICIPRTPVARADCAIVLTLSGVAVPALPAIAGGVVLIQQSDEGNYALTFAATGLPLPETIGNFNSYIGTITIQGQRYSAILSRTAPFEQEPTWAGTRIISVNPFIDSNTVTIAPFNIQTGIQTNPILGGIVTDCRR